MSEENKENNEEFQEVLNEEITPEVPWQMEQSKSKEQNLYLLENSVWTDCVFIVGDDGNKQTFSAHKLMLSKASPVFGAMLLGQLAETKDIHVTDIEPEVFQALLHYVYAEEIVVKHHTHLPGLFMAAQKYMMPALQKLCLKKMRETLCPATACWLYESAILIDDSELKQLAWKIILERTDEIVNDPSFQDVKYDTVLEIVKCESLYLDSEAPLIAACMKWAETQVEKEGLTKSREQLQKSLGEILQHLRILTISLIEFPEALLIYDVYSNEEKILILKTITHVDKQIELVDNLCTEVEKRQKTKLQIPSINFQRDVDSIDNNRLFVTSFSKFEPTCDITLHGFTVDLMSSYDHQPILKHLFVTIIEVDSTVRFTPKFGLEFCKPVKYNIHNINFADPIKLDAKKSYAINLSYNEHRSYDVNRKRASGFETNIAKNIFTETSFIARKGGNIILGMLVTKT